MKLSRRGKLARRGKHTKRVGKHLRYKSKSKKFSGSKRYHRGNKRTYKRGRRFHRGGYSINDIKNSSVRQQENLTFDYKRTDALYRFSEPTTGVFDVFIHARQQNVTGIFLVRHDKTNPGMYDKYLYISIGTGWNIDYKKMVIPGFDLDGTKSGTYIFPVGQNNADSYNAVNNLIIDQ